MNLLALTRPGPLLALASAALFGASTPLAKLILRGEFAPGQRWRQESITGSLFTGWLEEREGQLVPRIQGRAYITGRTTLYFDPRDPFRHGLAGHGA